MKEKRRKSSFNCSLKVVLKVRGILENVKVQTKSFHLRHEIFYKLYTLRKLLVIYSFTFIYSLPSRTFPNAKYHVVCIEFPIGSKFHFSQWKIHLSWYIFIDKYLKFKEIECLIYYIKYEKWPALYYVKFWIIT